MSHFARNEDPGPLRILQVGAGGMGKAWLRAIADNPGVELVALVDLDVAAAAAALTEHGLTGVAIGRSIEEVAGVSGAQAVVNVTVPQAHHPVNVQALSAGLPVLCEKPAAPSVAQAMRTAAAAEHTGQLLMISQSRRYFNALTQLKGVVAELGDLGNITTEFFKAPHFGGFREDMDHVLLLDMAIHPFDAVRYLTGREPVSVYCEEFNPSWSWYRADAAATAIFEFEGGLRYTYTGSWCADGQETSWNGAWRLSAAAGTATWDGDAAPLVAGKDAQGRPLLVPAVVHAAEQIAGSLAEFVSAVRTGHAPESTIQSNLYSLAMVEAAVLSASTGQRVAIDAVLNAAWEQALREESDQELRAVLASWDSPAHHVAQLQDHRRSVS